MTAATRRPLPLVVLALTTALALVTLVTLVAPGRAAAAVPSGTQASTTTYTRITSYDGTSLGAFVVTPTGQDGPRPLLVMPSSWGFNDTEYVGAAQHLAERSGDVVVSYTARGFGDSGGLIDVAGPKDVADARAVVDWALAHEPVDPQRIGMAGISYGAGISLLTAAADPRVRAVAAMSGWTDLVASLLPGGVVSEQAAAMLLALGVTTGRAGPPLQTAAQAYLTGDYGPVKDLAPERSAATKVDQINANHPAVLLANAWEDGIFPPRQYVDFFGRLDVPKRLMLTPGDHASPELAGAMGFPNDVWDAVGRWMDHYLAGADNGVDHEDAVWLRGATDGPSGPWASYPSWAAATPTTERFPLAARPTIAAGVPTTADSGEVMVSGATQQWFAVGPTTSLPLVSPAAAGIWETPSQAVPTRVQGAPQLHVTVTPSAETTTLFAYLYDVDALGTARLVTHKPQVVTGSPGAARAVDVPLEPVRWDVPAGHHLALVVDTMDPRYRSTSQAGSTVTFGSPAGDPSYLDVPRG